MTVCKECGLVINLWESMGHEIPVDPKDCPLCREEIDEPEDHGDEDDRDQT